MFPPSFGQTQITDIQAFKLLYREKSAEQPERYRTMTHYCVGSRHWIADTLDRKDLDPEKRKKLIAMLETTDCDLIIRPREKEIDALAVSYIRNDLSGVVDPGISVSANFKYHSLDVAVVHDVAPVYQEGEEESNSFDVIRDLEGNKRFDSEAHEAAYHDFINYGTVKTLNLRKMIDFAAENIKYKSVSRIVRTLRAYLKPLSVGYFDLETALALKSLLRDEKYHELRGNISATVQRRIEKKIMPPNIQSPHDLYKIVDDEVERSLTVLPELLRYEFWNHFKFIKNATKHMNAHFKYKYHALMEYIKSIDLVLGESQNFVIQALPMFTASPLRKSDKPVLEEYREMEMAVINLRVERRKIEKIISINNEIIKSLIEIIVQYNLSKMVATPSHLTAEKQEKVKKPKKEHKKLTERFSQSRTKSSEEDPLFYDEFIRNLDITRSNTPPLSQEELIQIEKNRQELRSWFKLDSEVNQTLISIILEGVKIIVFEVKKYESSFIHMADTLIKIKSRNEIIDYLRGAIKESAVYKGKTKISKNMSAKESCSMKLKIKEYDERLEQFLSGIDGFMDEITQEVNANDYFYNPVMTVYRTLSKYHRIRNSDDEVLLDIVGILRYMSNFFKVEDCAIALHKFINMDHHFYMKQMFPGTPETLIDWMIRFNPYYTPHHKDLIYVNLDITMKKFFPDYKISSEKMREVLSQLQNRKHDKVNYGYIGCHYVEVKLKELEKNIIHIIDNMTDVKQKYEARSAEFFNSDDNLNSPYQVLYSFVEPLKSGEYIESIKAIYEMLFFLKNHPRCNGSELYTRTCAVLYRLLEPQEQGLQSILIDLFELFYDFGIFNSMADQEYPAFMGNRDHDLCLSGMLARRIISVSIAMSTDKEHRAQLLSMYQYADNSHVVNGRFQTVFENPMKYEIDLQNIFEIAFSLFVMNNQFNHEAVFYAAYSKEIDRRGLLDVYKSSHTGITNAIFWYTLFQKIAVYTPQSHDQSIIRIMQSQEPYHPDDYQPAYDAIYSVVSSFALMDKTKLTDVERVFFIRLSQYASVLDSALAAKLPPPAKKQQKQLQSVVHAPLGDQDKAEESVNFLKQANTLFFTDRSVPNITKITHSSSNRLHDAHIQKTSVQNDIGTLKIPQKRKKTTAKI